MPGFPFRNSLTAFTSQLAAGSECERLPRALCHAEMQYCENVLLSPFSTKLPAAAACKCEPCAESENQPRLLQVCELASYGPLQPLPTGAIS